MDFLLLLKAALMGVVEGLTEFLPISSTGHLIVAGAVLNFPADIAAPFEIIIQAGAILAVVVFFARDLLALLRGAAGGDARARRLIIAVAIAFVPAAAIGLLFSSAIKRLLFNPFTVSMAMIAGGIVMLIVESWLKGREQPTRALKDVDYKQALGVGLAQIAALWPGMSRSASTIIGGLLMGMDRPTALRFSFYLSIPTLGVATLYELARSAGEITRGGNLTVFAIGFAVSFVVALGVVRWFLGWIAQHNLKPFAYYRIAAGLLVLVFFLVSGRGLGAG